MKLYIETVGCQMNELDSELVVASLRKDGYELTASAQDADTILFNTCSVRQHAEDKIYSALGRLKNAKREHPEKVIGVLGCMAQKDQSLIFKRAPYVDLVVGPGQLHQVPALVREIRTHGAARERRIEVCLGGNVGSGVQIERRPVGFDPGGGRAMRPGAGGS
jgi:tRNA-2-methylthio-N6-dimethylallyladenosine synthase